MAFLSSNGIASPTCAEKPGWRQLSGQLFGDRMAFDETGEEALAEQLHDRVSVPGLERVKRAIAGERAVGHEDVSMRMPL